MSSYNIVELLFLYAFAYTISYIFLHLCVILISSISYEKINFSDISFIKDFHQNVVFLSFFISTIILEFFLDHSIISYISETADRYYIKIYERKLDIYIISTIVIISFLFVKLIGLNAKYRQEKNSTNPFIQQIENLQKENKKLKTFIEEETAHLESFLSSKKEIMPYIAGMISDYLTLNFDRSSYYLTHKIRPAYKEAQRIQELKKDTKEKLAKYKIYEYQLKYLLALHPILEDELDAEFSDLISDDIPDNDYDPIRNYLSKEEWQNLSSTDKNQRALDNYIAKRNKSNWQIGRDYEMYIGQYYQNLGYTVDYFGIENGLEDLGRDLIARKGKTIFIIQCKCWSKRKIIHENAINQLFGSVTAFKVEHQKEGLRVSGVFITTVELSDTARKFADILKIKIIENMPLKEFPRIKCNISKTGEKIYHLPMDQQYDKVKIENQGEFYAYTVREAEALGFRRAFRYTRFIK